LLIARAQQFFLPPFYTGFRKSVGRRGLSQGGKDNDGSPLTSEQKSSKRGSASGYSSHEVLSFAYFISIFQ